MAIVPVYQHSPDPFTRLYVLNCIDCLCNSTWSDEEFDLIFADPPFNIDVDYGGEDHEDAMSPHAYGEFTRIWITRCVRKLADNGSIWIHIPDSVVHVALSTFESLDSFVHPMNWVIWHYRFGQHRTGRFINSKTHLLHYVKDPNEFTWNSDDILVASDRATKYNDKRTQYKESNPGKRVPLDVWHGPNLCRVQGNNAERRPMHPNQLPELLLARIILSCSNEGDTVFDPFCGSGTTSTVARALNRQSITCEINPQFAESAWHRITEIGMIRTIDELQNLYD